MHGVDCKEIGENVFMFTFKHERGGGKAVDGGPWVFYKYLLVKEEFVPEKLTE
jgi:hypothetical protein